MTAPHQEFTYQATTVAREIEYTHHQLTDNKLEVPFQTQQLGSVSFFKLTHYVPDCIIYISEGPAGVEINPILLTCQF